MESKVYIFKLPRLQASSASPILLDFGLQVCTLMVSKCLSKLARLQSVSASSTLLYHVLQVCLQMHLIMDTKCIPKLD
jgi:hypothetical protein